MHRSIHLTALLLVLVNALCIAQQDIRIGKNEFMKEKTGFREAWKSVLDGDDFYRLGGGFYDDAYNSYREALKYNPVCAPLNYKAGVSALLGSHPGEALDWLLRALEADPSVAPDILLLTGRGYQVRGEFGPALDFYNIYARAGVESGTHDTIVNLYIRECNSAVELVKNTPFEAVILNVEEINSAFDDYSPVSVAEKGLIYFTTRRPIEGNGRNRSDNKYDENIYMAIINDSLYGEPGRAGGELFTELSEGVLMVNSDNSRMYIYAGWRGSGDIMLSLFERGRWSKPEDVGSRVNTGGRETSFCCTGNGEEYFFTSDRSKGGQGGRDIWYTRKVDRKRWTTPYNLGELINTPANEEGVWCSPAGDTLWFSSDGHGGMGGFDIFVTFRDKLGNWSEPVNMGAPVNSPGDDLFYRPDGKNPGMAYMSSNRSGGKGGLDIYRVIIPEQPLTALPDSSLIVLPDSLESITVSGYR